MPMELAESKDDGLVMEGKILDYIKEHPGTWVERIARDLGHSRATITVYVRGLVSAQKVKSVKKGNLKELWPMEIPRK